MWPVTSINIWAPAKINLTLHVTGQRNDGYHLLDSLVVFVGRGDRITVEPAQGLQIAVTGPFAAGVPNDRKNLMWRAAEALRGARGVTQGAAMTLEKNLPHAAGIGSGSSDAAAILTALSNLWDVQPLPASDPLVCALGADVPVCTSAPTPTRMSGIGERLIKAPALPAAALVLVRPPVNVPTGPVFDGLATKQGSAMTAIPVDLSFDDFAKWLNKQRNDLQLPAQSIAPEISDVLQALSAQPKVVLARMSGSGATCFGLVRDAEAAADIAAAIQRGNPEWWVTSGPILGAGSPHPSASTAG